ncbi:MAG: hypothetical protein V7687_12950, partial [Maribacter arcticus]
VSNTSSVNTLSTTVDGVTGTGVDIINSNTLSLNGSNELVSTVNGEASTALDITPVITANELTTSLAAGTGISVSSSTPGNNTEYTVTNTAPDQTVAIADGGNGNVTVGGTYPNFTIDVPDATVDTDAQTIALNNTTNILTLGNGTAADTT